jgi:hypothetical protein
MKKQTSRTTREAMGCFFMLVFGAIMCVCLMRVALIAIGRRERGGQASWWPLDVILVVVPGVGIIVAGWLTYGFKSPWELLKRKRK